MEKVARRGRGASVIAVVALALIAIFGTRAPVYAQGDSGIIDEGEYESPSFGYEVSWSDDWTADEDQTTTSDDGDRLTLDTDDGFIFIVSVTLEFPPADVIDAVLSNRDPAPEIVDSESGDDLAWTLLSYEIDDTSAVEYIEARPIDGGVLLVSLTAPDDLYEEVMLRALDGVTIDGDTLFVSISGTDDTDAENDTESDDESRTSGTLTSATSPIWGVSVSYDTEIWVFDEDASILDENAQRDLLVLRSDVGSLYLDAKADYDGDPEACLEEEASILENESGIVAFEVAEGEDGPLAGTTEDGIVFAVYDSTIALEDDPDTEEDDSGEFDLSIYLECRTMVEGEAVVAVTLITSPDDFADQFDLALAVIDTIELPES